jgi:FkbM family methyltransferase
MRRLLERPLRFAVVEGGLRDGRIRQWRLRGGSLPVLLRSGTRDFDIFEEIFAEGEYDPVPEARAALARNGRPLRVVDLGGNIGLFAVRMLQAHPGCAVVSFEPDPGNLRVLRACAERSGVGSRWLVLPVAAGTTAGRATFFAGQAADSRIATTDDERAEAIEVPVVDVFEHLTDCDLLKIDIEGGEWDILADDRLGSAPPSAIVMEFHGYQKPRRDIRSAVTELLDAHGYEVRHTKWHPVGVGQLWAWRRPER